MNENTDILAAITQLYWERGINIQMAGVKPLIKTVSKLAEDAGVTTDEVIEILKGALSGK